MAIIKTISDLLWGMPLIVLILLAGIIFTVGSKFFQIAHLKHILKNTIGTLFSKKDNGKGMMKPLEVISIAVGGAVGVGNIGGVATAIAVGGPGAAFWIWVAAFLGMMMKMAEVSLAVYYRSKDEKGGYYGGPTYYMEKGLGRDKGFKFWGVLAVIFGIGIFGNVFSMQNFTVAQSVNATFGIPMLAVGLVYVGLTYLATVREIPWLGKLAAKVVPPMCVFYLVGGIVIIIVNITQLPAALGLIISDAFTGTAATGAFMGAGVALIIRTGLSRAMFSSEAGWGTSPMIHASAKTEHPVKQGLWGAFEVFVGTMCICTVKAGALGITSYEDKNGIEYYVMIVAHLDGENTVYHVYRALASNGIENARFSEVGSFESDKDFQGFGLITEDGTNDIYMIGLWSPSEGVTFADYAYLYQLNTETWTIGEALQQIHMVSVGGMAGMMGVHFRYGANVYVADDGTLTLSATERNSVLGSSLATNDWIPAIVN